MLTAHHSKHHAAEVWSPCLRRLVPAAIDSGALVVVQAWVLRRQWRRGCGTGVSQG